MEENRTEPYTQRGKPSAHKTHEEHRRHAAAQLIIRYDIPSHTEALQLHDRLLAKIKRREDTRLVNRTLRGATWRCIWDVFDAETRWTYRCVACFGVIVTVIPRDYCLN